MDEKITLHTEEGLQALNFVWARLLWISRGAVRNNDVARINADFLDAKKIVGFILADGLLRSFFEGSHLELHRYYFDYLESLNIEEFKQIKAYTIWERNGEIINDDIGRMKGDYLEACTILPDEEKLSEREPAKPPASLMEYINSMNLTDTNELKTRIVNWCYLAGYSDHEGNHRRAHNYIEEFYRNAPTAIMKGHMFVEMDYFQLVFENPHMANMLEVCFLIYLKPKNYS